MARFEGEPSEFIEKLVALNHVSKTVEGGHVFKFTALIVAGDRKGRVGFGPGKTAETPGAIRKGIENAKKSICTVTLSSTITPHKVIGEFGTGHMLFRPAAPGTDTVTGSPIRAIMEAAGIHDTRAKYLRSSNPQNAVFATFEGLRSLRSPEEVARIRGKDVSEIVG